MSQLLFWGATSLVLGLVVPAAVLLLSGWRLGDLGLGWPNQLGRRFILAGVVLSIPFGMWLLVEAPWAIARAWGEFPYLGPCAGLAMLGEHSLLSGIFAALLLPGRRLPASVPTAPVQGPRWQRLLRWLGLAQPAGMSDEPRVLAWLGLTVPEVFAILASAMMFLMIHVSKESRLELLLAFPGGAVMAYMTLRCRSIWPGLVAHYALNLIPLGLWRAFW